MNSHLSRFLMEFSEAIRGQVPYWTVAIVLGSVNLAVDSREFEGLVAMASLYLGVGAFVTFVRLKRPVAKVSGIFDVGSVVRNLYSASWWPWYLYNAIRSKG